MNASLLVRSGVQSVVSGAALIGCCIAGWATPPSVPSFRNDVLPVLEQRCAFCHNAEDPHGALVLERDLAWQMLVAVPSGQALLRRVEPGAPDRSYLMLKLLGTHQDVGGGARMPPGWLPLPRDEVDMIRRWIAAGAAAD